MVAIAQGSTYDDLRREAAESLGALDFPGYAVGGVILLVLYGVVPTLQPANFGRVYAAYGGVYILSSLLWLWLVEKTRPDHWDMIGACICLLGAAVILYGPRKG